MKINFENKNGFTLVEMLVAISLFIIVVFISIGSLLVVFDSNRKAQSSKTIVDNLNLTIENMSRTIRFGTKYHCGSGGTLSNPKNCDNNTEGDTFLAVNFQSSTIIYRWGGSINDPVQRSDNGGASYTNITAPEVKIERLRFYVFGTTAGDNTQPYVVVVMKGYVGNKTTSQTKFSIETLMSQRALDI